MPNEPFLCLQQAARTYKANGLPVTALHPTDLAVGKGAFICLAGPSGSGKTTILNLMGGIDTPTAGRVLINGQTTTGLSRAAAAILRREHIGFVFQAFNLIPVLTAYENVEYILLLKRVAEPERTARVEEVLAGVGLEKVRNKRPAELSGGQQQRVAVARAIVGAPPIVLADEPTGSLDSRTGTKLLDLLRRLNRERQTTFVFSSHDPLIIERADQVIRLQDGRIVES
ncbi:MAG: ABC transporter ATP-binding protein [Deltaproteobacteria bacterium]|jgi:putative ABC transport system ATP-binding protein